MSKVTKCVIIIYLIEQIVDGNILSAKELYLIIQFLSHSLPREKNLPPDHYYEYMFWVQSTKLAGYHNDG